MSDLLDRSSIKPAHFQRLARVRFEWGLSGAIALAPDVDIAVVIDVLSFTTSLTVALDRGITVLPYQRKGDSAEAYAAKHDAVLADSMLSPAPGAISLAPQSIRDAEVLSRLVLPSPNGSSIAFALAEGEATVLGASLRNADAAAEWVDRHVNRATTTVAVIASGEQWPNQTLRPSVEDLWGAGAVIDGLAMRGWTSLSIEAQVARQAWLTVMDDLPAQLAACASGLELIEKGLTSSVEIAAEVNQSQTVPILRDHTFVSA